MTRRTFALTMAGAASAADLPWKPLKVDLGPQQLIAKGVPWPYLVQLRDGTTIVLAHVRWPKGGKYPIHYTAVSHDGRKTWQEWKPSANQGNGPITEGTAVELRSGALMVFNVHAEHIGEKIFETDYWITRDSYRTLQGPKKFRFSMPEAEVSGKDDRGEPVSRLYLRRSMIELENCDLLACAYGRFETDKAPVEYLGAVDARVHRVETRGHGVQQDRGLVLHAAVRRDARLVRHLMETLVERFAARVEDRGARRRRADVDRDDDGVHGRPHSKMATDG